MKNDTDTVSHTAQLSMVFTERFFSEDDCTTSLIGEDTLEMMAMKLPTVHEVDLEFDTVGGELVKLETSEVAHKAWEETEKIHEMLKVERRKVGALNFHHEIEIVNTIYVTIYNALHIYTTPDGLTEVHAAKVSDMADYGDYGGDAIHEQRRMEGEG